MTFLEKEFTTYKESILENTIKELDKLKLENDNYKKEISNLEDEVNKLKEKLNQ